MFNDFISTISWLSLLLTIEIYGTVNAFILPREINLSRVGINTSPYHTKTTSKEIKLYTGKLFTATNNGEGDTSEQENNSLNEKQFNLDPPKEEHKVTRKRLVWLTGSNDLRTHDHGGFQELLEEEVVVPVFCLDPNLHLRSRSIEYLQQLYAAIKSMKESIPNLIFRNGSVITVLPELVDEIGDVTSVHVVADDVTTRMRNAQQSVCQNLIENSVEVVRWDPSLRPLAPWAIKNGCPEQLPSLFTEYCDMIENNDWVLASKNQMNDDDDNFLNNKDILLTATSVDSEGIPSWEEFLSMAEEVTTESVRYARSSLLATTQPYASQIAEWSSETNAQQALENYCLLGRDEFADQYLSNAAESSSSVSKNRSLYSAGGERLVRGNSNKPSSVLALREAPTVAFSSALSLGSLSSRKVLEAARNHCDSTPPVLSWDAKNRQSIDDIKNKNSLYPSDDPWWGRSSEGALADVVEWREWYQLLAQRSLALQESTLSVEGSSDDDSGDPRELGEVHYWRWKGQHLVRYLTWSAGKDYDEKDPVMLLIHGFAASAPQWERMVYSLRSKLGDKMPPIYAIDLLGFGHSEKPGLSYTQYLWESQIFDFCIEVIEAKPVVLAGNSIGGGLSCGVSSSLGHLCRGLILCNTAGVLVDPDKYQQPLESETSTEAALEGNPEQPYEPVPLVGRNSLDLFGKTVIDLIFPQVEERLVSIYGARPQNADQGLVKAIQQGATNPGSPNIIGSGQKLGPNRPLNEVICPPFGFVGPVLVVMGLEDRVSSPMVAQQRASTFDRLRDGVKVERLETGGHCPQDELPDGVAEAICKWLPQALDFVPSDVQEQIKNKKESYVR